MKKWKELSWAEHFEYEKAARDLIYPDLRQGYYQHRKALEKLAKTLYETHCLLKMGGGEQDSRCACVAVKSIFDEINNEIAEG